MPRSYQRPEPLVDVLEEYLEEASFLYGRRRLCLADPDLSWDDLRSCEDRLDAHLHGLVLGGAKSASILKDKLSLDEDGDPGEAFAAAATYPSLGLVESMQWLVKAVAANPPHLEAIIDGLSYNLDDGLDEWLDDFLVHGSPVVRRVGVEVRGRRWRTGCEGPLSRLVNDPDGAVALSATGVLVREGVLTSAGGASRHLSSPDPEVAGRAAWLLLEGGDATVLPWLRTSLATVAPEPGRLFASLLAAAGHPSDYQRLLALSRRLPEIQGECILALGLAGNMEAMTFLLERLNDPGQEFQYMMACHALSALTGVDEFPEFDLEEAGEEEIRGYMDRWSRWWDGRRKDFAMPLKWRRGQPISPVVLCEDLVRPGNPCRELTLLELRARYGCPMRWSPSARHETQMRQLAQIRQWAEGVEKDFKPGQVYFARKPAV